MLRLSKEMNMQEAHLQSLAEYPYTRPPSYMHDEDFEEIEAYVKNLETEVEERRDSVWTTSSRVGRKIREETDALCLKAEVILWRIRGAKHFTYPARQVLWEDIQKSIAKFEQEAEFIVNMPV
jgi:hypothetical protein